MSDSLEVLAIDPGDKGGFAAIQFFDGEVELRKAWPLHSKKMPDREYIKAVKGILEVWDESICTHSAADNVQLRFVLETQYPHPKNSRKGIFNQAYKYGLLAATLDEYIVNRYGKLPEYDGTNFFTMRVHPTTWKTRMGLSSKKSDSIKMADKIFGLKSKNKYWPDMKYEGVAESALLALWYVHRWAEAAQENVKRITST